MPLQKTENLGKAKKQRTLGKVWGIVPISCSQRALMMSLSLVLCFELYDRLQLSLLRTYQCLILHLSSVLNSVTGLPSVRRAAVQAWLETVSGGSLVIFDTPPNPPFIITSFSRQLCWRLNSRTQLLSLVHARAKAVGGVHACFVRQPICAWTRCASLHPQAAWRPTAEIGWSHTS